MENDIEQTQVVEQVPEIQKVAPKPKFSLSRTKIMIGLSVIILLSSIGVAAYQYNKDRVTTTGAIPVKVVYAENDPEVELNKLLDKGDFSESGFNVKHIDRSSEVAVFLDKPYEENQAKFEIWLKDNGFREISKDDILYFHNP